MSEFDSWKAQEAAAYLNRVRKTLLDIQRLQDEIDVQYSLLPPGLDYTRDRVKTPLRPDGVERAVMRIFDLIETYASELSECVEQRLMAVRAIDKLEDVRYKAVLTMYYVNGHSWEEIGTKPDGRPGLLSYSVQYCKELRAEALPLFWDVMPNEEKTRIPRAD